MRIGIDTGGTFTDLLLILHDEVITHKLPSTPDDPARAVIDGLGQILQAAKAPDGRLDSVIHGSTVATNALLERKGARAAVVTTAGFEDVLEIGRQARPKLHTTRIHRPTPIVPKCLRIGVRERVGPDGSIIEPLRDDDISKTLARLNEASPDSVAIVLLHSYANPSHEKQLASAIEAALDVPTTVSHELLPEYREYERTSTCVVNAYVSPKMAGYLNRLESHLRAMPGKPALRVMRSDGGTMSSRQVSKAAVHTVLSGPAGGVVGASAFTGCRAITFDMGGTSTDVCMVESSPCITTEAHVGGHPIRVPVLDIQTVGAGGGSIAWKDAGGAMRVGPRSAGATPGPACYGLGGEDPTVTDANLVLGRLPTNVRLAGTMPLDPAAARAALSRLAESLRISPESCAQGIIRIANVIMMRALRRISLERGKDPRRLTLISFGGAGGLHACELASSLSMDTVIVPPDPGVLSAWGMLIARPERELGRSVLVRCPSVADFTAHSSSAELLENYEELETRLVAQLQSEGIDATELRVEWLAELRYEGQSHNLTVCSREPRPPDDVTRTNCNGSVSPPDRKRARLACLSLAIEQFEKDHESSFGYRMDRAVEWVAARVRARGPGFAPPVRKAPPGEPVRARGGIHQREELAMESRIAGPASIVEYSATTYVAKGWACLVLSDGTLKLRPERHMSAEP